MVREVEFSNESEVLAKLENYSNAADQPLFEGYLSNEGLTLNVKVHIPLKGELVAQRYLKLYYGNTNFIDKTVEYIELGDSGFDYRQDGNNVTDIVYSFDISQVVSIPRTIYSTGGTSEITIELYTYEANISTDYGSKTLSVPYTVNNDSNYEYDKSTDGIYRLVMVDVDPWISTRVYGIGDIAVINGSLIMSTISGNTAEITDSTSWTTPTNEDFLKFCRGMTKHPPIRAFVTDILISRYAKYGIMKDILTAKSFKEYDNKQSDELILLLQSLRERAKYNLIRHKPIDAAYSLQLLKQAASVQTDTTKVRQYNINYSYTV